MESDIMDDFLLSGWAESPHFFDRLGSPAFSPLIDISNIEFNPVFPDTEIQKEDEEKKANRNFLYLGAGNNGNLCVSREKKDMPACSYQSSFVEVATSISGNGRRHLIQPKIPITLQEKLTYAFNSIMSSQSFGNVLIQIWLPVKMGDRCFLSTFNQPFLLDQNCDNLLQYRTVSTNYRFSAEKNSTEAPGLPGRVFVGRAPEWIPDVRYYASNEFPRVSHAQRCDVRSTIALPMFEANSHLCIGVVEVASTSQNINYHSDVENICNALQAADLKTSDDHSINLFKAKRYLHKAPFPEILELLKFVCDKYRLPLAQTWIPSSPQSRRGDHLSLMNYVDCLSTANEACYVKDPSLIGFHEACSKHLLLRGKGIVGMAFTKKRPCFSPDVKTFSEIEYPLLFHAKLFNLRAAAAFLVQSSTGDTDLVLEFFLPFSCREPEEQRMILKSLPITIQQVCQSLNVVFSNEIDEENYLYTKPVEVPLTGFFGSEPPWSTSVIEHVYEKKSTLTPSIVPFNIEESRFSDQQTELVIPAGKLFSEHEFYLKALVDDVTDHNHKFYSEPTASGFVNATRKKRMKVEKTINMQVLQQYFTGSLKHAANSIGVCPTTLKRICRQHGITRWPSRKIKKVDHTLRTLQAAIDSVQVGEVAFQFNSLYENLKVGEVAFQFNSLYENLTKSSGSGKKASEKNILIQVDALEPLNERPKHEANCRPHTLALNSDSSSCNQSSNSSLGDSCYSKQSAVPLQLQIDQETAMDDSHFCRLKRPHGHAEAETSSQVPSGCLTRPHNRMGVFKEPSSHQNLLKIKAVYGGEKVRFRLLSVWGLLNLKQEVSKRFNISDSNLITLKYLDDDFDWILLTCDADLQECVDIYRSSNLQTVKIFVHSTAHRSSHVFRSSH